jgi:hypothetical protein
MIVKSAEEEVKLASQQVLDSLEQTVLGKISELNSLIKGERDPVRLRDLGEVVRTWLAALEQARKLKSA